MCGILFYQGLQDLSLEDIKNAIKILDLRGPDNHNYIQVNNNKHMGFTRLSINDVSTNGNQPLELNNIFLICNGEIYNHKKLKEENDFFTNSNSDCEIILHMYQKYGIDYTVKNLDGVFAFVLYDKNINTVYAARDPFGVRPLFIGKTITNELLVCSEINPISKHCIHITPFSIGSYCILDSNIE